MNTKICDEPGCGTLMVWLISAKDPDKRVPTDRSTVSDEDAQVAGTVFDGSKGHVSHFKTCKNPSRFNRRKEKP